MNPTADNSGPAAAASRFAVAPMMDWTTRDCRVFHRLLTRRALLYTEMVTSGALLHGDIRRHLDFDPVERPLALQLGGSEPAELARCAALAGAWGYDEVNLNVGCPSDRVQNGRFGACLMKEPALVAECVAAMAEAVRAPVTVKTRIGVDDIDHYDHLAAFAGAVADAGCDRLIVHARKAWLKGLSPKANREVPPLDYERVHRLKSDFPALPIVLNGGVESLSDAARHLERVDGVMLGRAAYRTPYLLTEVDPLFFEEPAPVRTRVEAVESYRPYVAQRLAQGAPLTALTRHLLGLFQGCRGGRRWRRFLSEHAHRRGAGLETLDGALAEIRSLNSPVEEAAAL